MGLDMSFYSAHPDMIERRTDCPPEINFNDHTAYENYEDYCKLHEIAYFRKHNRLHGWLMKLYYSKGGKGSFNGDALEITLDDVRHLKCAIKNDNMDDVSGFFWGTQRFDRSIKKQYNQLCRKIRRAIKDGLVVYYNSSW